MDRSNVIIGGEHVFNPPLLPGKIQNNLARYLNSDQAGYHASFTFGGYYCLLAIIDDLKRKHGDDFIVALPSYLCPTILKPFKAKGISYRFYRVDINLMVDNNHLISLLEPRLKAVLFIDYFGASQYDSFQNIVHHLRSQSVAVIQDAVQCLDVTRQKLFGDYVFTSYRKFFPFEAGLLLSRTNPDIHFKGFNFRFLLYKRIGQLLRYFHLKYGWFNARVFLNCFESAEKNYYRKSVLKLPRQNLKRLLKVDIRTASENQIRYFNRLNNEFESLIPDLLRGRDFIPMGFIIRIPERDKIRALLFKQNIYPPVHWVLTDEIDSIHFKESIELSSEILTIPLIGLNDERFEYLLKQLKSVLKYESLS